MLDFGVSVLWSVAEFLSRMNGYVFNISLGKLCHKTPINTQIKDILVFMIRLENTFPASTSFNIYKRYMQCPPTICDYSLQTSVKSCEKEKPRPNLIKGKIEL